MNMVVTACICLLNSDILSLSFNIVVFSAWMFSCKDCNSFVISIITFWFADDIEMEDWGLLLEATAIEDDGLNNYDQLLRNHPFI